MWILPLLLLLQLIAAGAAREESAATSGFSPFFRRPESTNTSPRPAGVAAPEQRFSQTSVGYYLARRRMKGNRKQVETATSFRDADLQALLQRLRHSALQQLTTPTSVAPDEQS
ncbi:hypothetical protein, conserved [Eimeria maxima]|uniref:Uncharacterized protein n=1 Tax=Eimeria maxima TaxID=5804 RepID=U6LZH5_EIMMA|nr:hypothetical protein, conserved [Eimeria maxima]CDJ57146.1 hypothetical protein, conserved [Eimeria maxima]